MKILVNINIFIQNFAPVATPTTSDLKFARSSGGWVITFEYLAMGNNSSHSDALHHT